MGGGGLSAGGRFGTTDLLLQDRVGLLLGNTGAAASG